MRLQFNDERSKQRQEAAGCPHRCTCIRDHSSPYGPEPNPGLAVFSTFMLHLPNSVPLHRSSLMPSSTLALAKILLVSVLRVLSVARPLTFHHCGESTKQSRYSLLAYVQPCAITLHVCLSHGLLRHASRHSVMLNRSQSASRMNSSMRQRVLRTHMLSRFAISNFEFLLLMRSHAPHRKKMNSSVLRSQIGENSSSAECAVPAVFASQPLSACICMSSTCLSYGNSRAILRQNRNTISPNAAI